MEFYSDEESDRFVPDGLFKDGWIHELGPLEWSSPGASLDSEVFWKTFHDCSNKLPKNIAAVFNLREVDGVESKEICGLLNISESNLWVMLHRARMALRRCLETNWFGQRQGGGMKIIATIKERSEVWVWQHTPHCTEILRLASQSLEQPLSFRTRLKMRLHFLICVWCERYDKQLKFLHHAAAHLDHQD